MKQRVYSICVTAYNDPVALPHSCVNISVSRGTWVTREGSTIRSYFSPSKYSVIRAQQAQLKLLGVKL